jgi:membrane-anchored protein YejM (alkaline phosphatase superfamily)
MVETGHKFHDNVSRLINWGHWFTFFNLIIVSLISLRYVKYAGLSDTEFGIAYQFTSLIGHFSFLCAVFFGVILFPLAFVISSQRLYRLLSCIISSLAIALLILDTQIFKLYNFHLNPLIWQFFQNRPEQVEQIYSINLHYISIPILFIMEMLLSSYIWKKCRFLQRKAIGKPIAFFLLSTFLLTHLIFIWADATQYRPITQEKSIYPLSYPMTARTFLKKQGWLNDDKLLESMNEQSSNKVSSLRYPITPISYQPNQELSEAKNVLLITVDALRADMLNANNMPFVYQISQQGLTYKNHFSGASNRHQGLFSLFYALPNRYWYEITLNYIPPVLISRFAQENYQFGLFSSIGFLHPEFLQSSFSQISNEELKHYSTVNNNPRTTKKWQKWISKQNNTQKWFSFLYYKQPNKPISKDKTAFSLAARTEKLSRYQQQVLEIDKQIKEVISTLRAKQQLDNTIVLITGTHGASFEKKSSVEATLNNAHVPLVVLWPGEDAGTITRMTSHVDIVPTLMAKLLGSQTDADQYSSGQSLFDDKPRQYLLSGDLNKYVIYENDKITQFSNDGQINSINWDGDSLDNDKVDITLLIDVLSKLRRFNAY